MPAMKTMLISGYPADALSQAGVDAEATYLPNHSPSGLVETRARGTERLGNARLDAMVKPGTTGPITGGRCPGDS
jgi:hypothetical protein